MDVVAAAGCVAILRQPSEESKTFMILSFFVWVVKQNPSSQDIQYHINLWINHLKLKYKLADQSLPVN